MKDLLLFLSLIMFTVTASGVLAQPCNDEALLKIPGTWKKGVQGSIDNVKAEDLAREKQVLLQLENMIRSKFTPYGCDISYSTVFGYNKHTGKNWRADPYEMGVRLMKYYCDHKDNDISKKWVDPETGTVVYFSVNSIWSSQGVFRLKAAELPDDHYDPGYLVTKSLPVKKEGYYLWKLHEQTEREKYVEYQYLVTYDGKLPFIPFTRKEYLEVKIPEVRKFVTELESNLKDINPDFDRASKDAYESGKAFIDEKKGIIQKMEDLLRTMSPEELNKGAVLRSMGPGDFEGFRDETDEFVNILVKPDPDYYKPLPKWVPQFFCIVIRVETDENVFMHNMQEIEKNIDFSWFRKMLGSTTIIPAGSAVSPQPSTPQPASNGLKPIKKG